MFKLSKLFLSVNELKKIFGMSIGLLVLLCSTYLDGFADPVIIKAESTYISPKFMLSPSYKPVGLSWDQECGTEPFPPEAHSPFTRGGVGSSCLYVLEKNGSVCWKHWFEPVNDEIEHSRYLKVHLEKKIDDGIWVRVLKTVAPRIKPTLFKSFTDEFLPRKLTKKEVDEELKSSRLYLKECREKKKGIEFIDNAKEMLDIKRRQVKNEIRSRNIYRFVIENPNKHRVYLFKE